jgi:hypothetical protein
MTLLDAPVFNEARERHHREIFWGTVGGLFVLIVGFWFVSGRPVDWPWNWPTHLRARSAINHFLTDVEKNDLSAAYGVWVRDRDWQKHPDLYGAYSFPRFQQDWSPNSSQNEYGAIHSHDIVAARMSGNVLVVGIRMNGQKSNALFLNYDPHTHGLGFSPVELYLGP